MLALQQMLRSCCSCLLFENRSDAPSLCISQSPQPQYSPFIVFPSGQTTVSFDDDRLDNSCLILYKIVYNCASFTVKQLQS